MAVEDSVKQMALTRDVGPGGFMERVQANLVVVAGTVLKEPAATAHHDKRAFHAQKVVQSPQQLATLAGPQVVMVPFVITQTTYDEATKTSTCTVTDAQMQPIMEAIWNQLAAIDTPS